MNRPLAANWSLAGWKRFAALSCLAVAAGCNAATDIVPVSGRVTLGGQPLPGAVVTFQPVQEPGGQAPNHRGSVGSTDADGRYELRLIEPDQPGARVGKHRVTITTASVVEGDDAQLANGERVPLAWRNGSQTFIVPEKGTSQADFEIP